MWGRAAAGVVGSTGEFDTDRVSVLWALYLRAFRLFLYLIRCPISFRQFSGGRSRSGYPVLYGNVCMTVDHGAVLEWGETEWSESRGQGKTTVMREGASLREREHVWRCDRWMQRAQTRKSERGAARRSMRLSIGSWLTATGCRCCEHWCLFGQGAAVE